MVSVRIAADRQSPAQPRLSAGSECEVTGNSTANAALEASFGLIEANRNC
jgi:hypothetical protein